MTQPIDDGRAHKRPSRRTLILWLLGLLFAWLIWSRFAELETVTRTLLEGRLEWVLLAAVLQVAYFCGFAGLYRSAFDTVGLKTSFRYLLPLTVAAVFADATMMGGAAGTVLFVDDARRRGHSGARATTGTLLVMASDYAAFSVLLTFGLVLLVRLRDLTRLEGISAAIMYLLMFIIIGLLGAGMLAPGPLRGFFALLQRALNAVSRFIWRENWLRAEWAHENANEFIVGSAMLSEQPGRVVRTIAIAFVTHLFSLTSLFVMFYAFNATPRLSAVIALYAMTNLFTVVSPTPSGAGVVETVMPAIYVSLGVPIEVGTLVNLSFRAINVWIPLIIGFFITRRLRAFQSEVSVPKATDETITTVVPSTSRGPTAKRWLRLQWLPAALVVLTVAVFVAVMLPGGMGRVGGWNLLPLILPLVGVLGLLICLVLAVAQRPRTRALLWSAVLSLLALLALVQAISPLVAYPASLARTQPAATVRLPADAPLQVAWGGNSVRQNYHAAAADQRWAYDLTVAPSFTQSARLQDYGCYGVPVLAPAAGTVVVAKDGLPDETPGGVSNNFLNPAGNYVAIQLADIGTYLLIAHLQPGSVAVREGEQVVEGQVLGACGNSGNTSEPHIHIHHQRQNPRDYPIGFAEGLPLYFRDHDGPPMPTGGFRIENGRPVLLGPTVQHQQP